MTGPDRLGELIAELTRLVDRPPEEEVEFGDDDKLEFVKPRVTDADLENFERLAAVADELWYLHREMLVLEDAA
jgi:hypothetical protein